MSAAAGGPPRLGRAPWTTAGDLDAAQRGLVDRIRDDWGDGSLGVSPFDSGGRLVGPFDLMAASPHVGAAVLEAAASFRDSDLAVIERELVILVVAVAERAGFMWAGHRPVALAAGLAPEAAESIRAGEVPRFGEPLCTVHRVARRLVDEGDLDDAAFDDAVDRLGWRRLQEVVWLTGLYRALGLAMRVARSPLPGTDLAGTELEGRDERDH
ncbi:carboxymuconolactone decarboxylase family protein [Actinomadura welshii]|uniref:carboxymuconolactone decarboxylase family protein n=1 Tax=Actinomadura welshii TaxID=3103817 RepID=UPI0003ACDF68|nr:carboxymuconolactone decarboxylase family protein [Actinomadura madurae]